MKKKMLSAIVACYKDAQVIPIMHKRLVDVFTTLRVDYEIIFVNDGSPDDSEDVIRKLVNKDSHVIGITHSRNFSSQMAFVSGMNIAQGDAVILLDGDLQDPPEIIPKFYKKWQEGYDIVYGKRTKREAPFYMQVLYKAFYRLFNKISYIPIPHDAGDFSLLDKKIVMLLMKFPERDVFLRGLRAWVGFKQVGVAYTRPERLFGKSTNNLMSNINWAFKGIFSFSYMPLQTFTMLSFVVFLLSLIAIIYQIFVQLFFAHAPQGITTILVVVLFLGSIQLLGISILGQYIGKIFEEVKQRPKYIVKNIIRRS